MKSRLLVSLDETWPQNPACAWLLLGPDGRELDSGVDEPQRWPAADSREFLLRGAQTLWLEVTLPKTLRTNVPQVLRYQLEDKLIDVDRQHFVITHRRPAEEGAQDRVGVLVVDRQRLARLIEDMNAAGQSPDRICAEIQTAPADDGFACWSVTAHGAILRTNLHRGVAVDHEMLASVLAGAVRDGDSDFDVTTANIRIRQAPGITAPSLVSGARTPPPPIDAPYLWWQGLTAAAVNLRQGEFARQAPLETTWLPLRLPLGLATMALVFWLVAGSGQVLWLRHQEQLALERTADLFRQAFPDTPAVMPATQMQRLLDDARSRHGLLRHDDALSMLGRAGASLEPESLERVKFEDGRLELVVAESAGAHVDDLITRVRGDGLLAEKQQTANGTRILIRPEPRP